MKAKKLLALLLVATFVVSCMTFTMTTSAVTATGDVLDVPTANEPITADGVIDTTSEWKNAMALNIGGTDQYFAMTQPSFAKYGEGSTIYMMWDATNLYIGLDVKDPTISASAASTDALDSGFDTMEIRFGTAADTDEGHLTTYTAVPYFSDTEAAGIRFGADMATGMSAVSNQTADRTDNWVMEITISFASISGLVTKAGDTVAAGDNVYIQFRTRENTNGLGVFASQKDQGPFGGAKNTYVFSASLAGNVYGNPNAVISGTESYTIPYTDAAPTIDGVISASEWSTDGWINLNEDALTWLMNGNDDFHIGNSYGLAMWDATNLYLAFDVRDMNAANYPVTGDQNDGIDFRTSDATKANDKTALIVPNAAGNPAITIPGVETTTSTIDSTMYDSNYVIEVAIPWTEVANAPAALVNGATINMDFRVRNFKEAGLVGWGMSGTGSFPNTWDTYTLTKPLVENPDDVRTGTETFEIPYAKNIAPTIDGVIKDAEWNGAEWVDLSDAGMGWLMKNNDLCSVGASYGLLKWDDNYLYVAVDMRDTTESNATNSGVKNQNTDGLDIYTFNADHGNEKAFWAPSTQADTKSTQLFTPANAVSTDGLAASKTYGSNYVIELAIPWTEYENLATAENGAVVSFDLRIRNWNTSGLIGWGFAGTGSWPNQVDNYTLTGKPLAPNDPVAPSANDKANKYYVTEKTSDITFDGYLADSEWSNAERISLKYEDMNWWLMGKADHTDFGDSYVLMQWDADNLYLALNIEDKNGASSSMSALTGDRIQLQMYPSNESTNQYARFDMFPVLTDTGAGYVFESNSFLGAAYDVGATIASTVYGSEYVTEVAIPWSILTDVKAKFAEKGLTCDYEAVAGESFYFGFMACDVLPDGSYGCGWGLKSDRTSEVAGGDWSKARDEYVLVGAPTLEVADQEAKIGNEFSVDVNLANNAGIVALRYQIEYDTDVLELVSVTDKELLAGYMEPSPDIASPYILGWEDALAETNNTDNGVVATLNFKIKDNATTGDYTVTVTPIEAWATVNDFTGKEIAFLGSSATIKVIEAVHSHTMTHHAAVAATCTETGTIEYWECTDCGKLYSDAEGNDEITAEDLTTDMIAHTLTHHDAVAATCTETGTIEYWECSVCGKLFADAEAATVITSDDLTTDMIEHSYETKYDADGHWTECSVCQATTEKAAHEFGEWEVVSPAELGIAGTKKHTCACGYSEEEEIAALGDVNGDGEITSEDAIVLARYLVGWKNITIDAELSDVDGDGRVSDWDSIMIQRYLAGWFE